MTVADYKLRWKSGNYVGPRKPSMLVEYRLGRLMHGYAPWDGPPIGAFVAGGYIRNPGDAPPSGWPVEGYGRLYWQNTWTPADGDDGEYAELPNVLEWEISQAFDNNGLASLTLDVENVAYPEVVGPGGAYHSIKRGYYAPKRGDKPAGGVPLMEGNQSISPNEWFDKFNAGDQIRVWHGYGDALLPAGVFLVDDIDVESRPDKITITARDHGQALTDMRLFGWNKEPRILDPVVFCDRLRADKVKKVGYDYRASSEHPDHPIALVADDDSDTYWLSDGHNDADNTEWIQLKVPEGRYEDFYLFPRQAGMDMYVSVYARDRTSGPASLDGDDLPEGWVDLAHGDVPEEPGVPYVHHREGLLAKGVYVGLRGVYKLGAGSTIRVSFRRLRRRADGDYYAGCNRFFANKRALSQEARKKHWVLVDDASDMVRQVLRWAGFKEWEVESSGVRLGEKFIVARSNFYIDVIEAAKKQTGFQFFMNPPAVDGDVVDDRSLGIPVFRRPKVVNTTPVPNPPPSVRDTDLITGLESKDSDEAKAYIIRVRGRTAKESEGGEVLSGDRTKRLMYEYRPPWWRQLGGIVKHVVYTNQLFKRKDDVKFGAWYIALQEALESDKATCEFPGNALVTLDTHVAVMDVGTGLATRIWVSDRRLRFRRAEQPENNLAVGGAIADSPDVREIAAKIDGTPRSSEH